MKLTGKDISKLNIPHLYAYVVSADMPSALAVFDRYYAGLPSLEVQREAKYINACRKVFDKESSISQDVVCMAELNVNKPGYNPELQIFAALVLEKAATLHRLMNEKKYSIWLNGSGSEEVPDFDDGEFPYHYNLAEHYRPNIVNCFYRQVLRFALKTLHTCLYARGAEKEHPRADECRVLTQFYLLVSNENQELLPELDSYSLAEINKKYNAERNNACAIISSASTEACKKYARLAPKTKAAALVKFYPRLQSKVHSASSKVSFHKIAKEFIKTLNTDLYKHGNVSADLICETVDLLMKPTTH